MIIKSRNLGTVGSAGAHWSVSHQGLTGGLNGGNSAQRVFLSLTNAESANAHGAISAASSTTVTFKDGSGNSDDAFTAGRIEMNLRESKNFGLFTKNLISGSL